MGNPWDYDFSAVGARTSPLLIVHGSDIEAKEKGEGYRVSGNSDVYRLLPQGMAVDQVNLNRQFLKGPPPDPARYDCVLNLVTDPDQHPKTLEKIRKLLKGYKGRVVNRPETVLRTSRDQVAKRLAGIDGLRVPNVLRLRNPKLGGASAAAGRQGFEYPIIVRLAGSHMGKIVGLVETPRQLDEACSGKGEFLLIEFVDFRSADGLYRKSRLWSLGGQTILRHSVAQDDWNVHVRARHYMLSRPELIEQELRLLRRLDGDFPEPVHRVFDAVRDRMGLDFFGMDFGIAQDGRVVLFEANATMSFFPLVPHPRFAYFESLLQPARAAVAAMIGRQE